ncbi:MAG: AbrB/MazE/SpoVT family DNA-binding domain-containing protein [Elusimicrobia bacterium]|nr:AbrB/MazE/SpoVT family DNA-binding domain-containing protein [Candidatus Liberimonas magnetica]
MMTTIMTTKGQIVIPSRIRRHMNIKKGSKLYIEEEGDKIVIKPMNTEYFNNLAGVLQTKGKLTKTLIEERVKEREKEGHK